MRIAGVRGLEWYSKTACTALSAIGDTHSCLTALVKGETGQRNCINTTATSEKERRKVGLDESIQTGQIAWQGHSACVDHRGLHWTWRNQPLSACPVQRVAGGGAAVDGQKRQGFALALVLRSSVPNWDLACWYLADCRFHPEPHPCFIQPAPDLRVGVR